MGHGRAMSASPHARAEIVVDLGAIRRQRGPRCASWSRRGARARRDGRGQGRRLRPRDPPGGAARPATRARSGSAWRPPTRRWRCARPATPVGCCAGWPRRARTSPAVDRRRRRRGVLRRRSSARSSAAPARAGRPARVQLKVDTGLSRGGAARGRLGASSSRPRAGRARPARSRGHRASGPTSPAPTSPTTRPTTPRSGVRGGARPRRPTPGSTPRSGTWPTPRARCCAPAPATTWCGSGSRPTASPRRRHVVAAAELGLVPAMTVRAPRRAHQGHRARRRASPTATPSSPTGRCTSRWSRSGTATASRGTPRRRRRGPASHGERGRVLGRVCMDQFVVDAPARHGAGDEVVLFGPGDDGEPTAQDWAEWCGTISYEIVTRMRRQRRAAPSAGGSSR